MKAAPGTEGRAASALKLAAFGLAEIDGVPNVSGLKYPFCVPAGRLMIAGGLIPRMITKRFPRHGVTVQNGRELIALSAVKPLEASRRDGSQIGGNDEIPKYPSTKE